jgi:gentisate 1,2-dioxygenase
MPAKQIIDVPSTWVSSDMTLFNVTSVVDKEDGTWVYYNNPATGQEYNCLIDAFLSRFHLGTN